MFSFSLNFFCCPHNGIKRSANYIMQQTIDSTHRVVPSNPVHMHYYGVYTLPPRFLSVELHPPGTEARKTCSATNATNTIAAYAYKKKATLPVGKEHAIEKVHFEAESPWLAPHNLVVGSLVL